jgi:cholesterol 7-dehydrogenase
MTKKLQFRGETKHHINCHIQDIPENGADILHFKYVHIQAIKNFDLIKFMWNAKWKRGDDPDIK